LGRLGLRGGRPERVEEDRRGARARWGGPLASTLLLLAGCGGAPSVADEAAAVVTVSGPAEDTYRTGVEGDPPGGANEDLVRRAIAAAAVEAEPPVEDPRLHQVARWVAERLGPGGEPPPVEAVDFLTRHAGLVEPTPHYLVFGRAEDRFEEELTAAVVELLATRRYNRWGVSITRESGGYLAVLLLSWRWLELDPVPRRVEPGVALSLRGRVDATLSNPAVAVSTPDGQVRRIPAGSGPDFDVRVPTSDVGVYRIELLGRGERGTTVVANFPVYVGEPVPTSMTLSAGGEETREDVEAVRARLFELLNQTRREAGIPELLDNVAVREVAAAHSRDMAENDFVGHESPTTGSPADRVRDADLPSALVLENIGRGYSAEEIHRGLLDSPGHRANLLNPDVTHVGIGVVAGQEGDRPSFLVTEVFVLLRRAVDLEGAAPRLLARINEGRRGRRAPRLEERDHLTEAAQAAAERFFADPATTQQDIVDDAPGSLRRFGVAYRRLGGLMAIVASLREAEALEPLFDPEVRYLGIGVAQGTRPDTGPNALAVVYILAWPRTAE
jgi:uncharacterized protein YkwD